MADFDIRLAHDFQPSQRAESVNVNQRLIDSAALKMLVDQQQPANAEKHISMPRQLTADVTGVASTFVASWGISKALSAAESYLPLPPAAKAALSIGTGLVVGGMVNNGVAGRELSSFKGFGTNAEFSALTYFAYVGVEQMGSSKGIASLADNGSEVMIQESGKYTATYSLPQLPRLEDYSAVNTFFGLVKTEPMAMEAQEALRTPWKLGLDSNISLSQKVLQGTVDYVKGSVGNAYSAFLRERFGLYQ